MSDRNAMPERNWKTGDEHYCSRTMRLRRQKELRMRQIRVRVGILAAFIALAVAGTVFAADGLRTEASSEHAAYKYYNSVTVQYGEHFSDVARRYYDSRYYDSFDVYVREICSINNIAYFQAEETVRPGNSLIVAYYAEDLR